MNDLLTLSYQDGKVVRLYCEGHGYWIELMAQDFRESEQWAAALRQWCPLNKGAVHTPVWLLTMQQRSTFRLHSTTDLFVDPPTPDEHAISYAPGRQNVMCRWFVDGKDTFYAIYRAIKGASSSVFITDWWMVCLPCNPLVSIAYERFLFGEQKMGEIYLKRSPTKVKPHHRLDLLLKRKAEEGLRLVHIVMNGLPSSLSSSV